MKMTNDDTDTDTAAGIGSAYRECLPANAYKKRGTSHALAGWYRLGNLVCDGTVASKEIPARMLNADNRARERAG